MSANELPEGPTALDWASFYVESVKYGARKGTVQSVDADQLAAQFEVLLREAGVTAMTGAELLDALPYYVNGLAAQFKMSPRHAGSCFVEGLMLGVALGGGLRGQERNPRGVL